MALVTAMLDEPTGYGRIVRNAGQVDRIVEEKDASSEIKAIQEVNSGTYVFRSPQIFSILKEIGTANAQNEFYLTDAVALCRKQGAEVCSIVMEDAHEVLGVNSLSDLELLAEKMAS
jgi:bifunctional UDP-N-acetylglucosamine pyrophosphorylase/glucosamine-1-phosphate N-acetyltransferase